MTSTATTNVSVVIPTAREEVLTPDSLPAGVDVEIRRDEGLNRARNAGVDASDSESVVILDDDLVFSEAWFRDLCDRLERNPDTVFTARGTGILADISWPPGFEPGMGRVMAFRKAVWRDAGGFPEPRSHGGDTDFLMSAYENGYTITGIDHEWDHVDDEEDVYSLSDNLGWLWFLTRRHTGLVAPRLPSLLATKLGGGA